MYQSKRKTSNKNILKIGDIVMIKDDKIRSRNSWRIGLVESLVIGKDGNISGALLTTRSNEGKRTNISRPVQKLIPLEITSDSSNIDSSLNNENINRNEHVKGTSDMIIDNPNIALNDEISSCDVASSNVKSYPRPRRKAAETGEEVRRITSKGHFSGGEDVK